MPDAAIRPFCPTLAGERNTQPTKGKSRQSCDFWFFPFSFSPMIHKSHKIGIGYLCIHTIEIIGAL